MQSLSSPTKSSSSSSSSSESDDVEVRAVYTEEKVLPERVPMRPSRGGLSKTRRLKQKIKELKAKIHTLKDAHRLEMKFMADALLNTAGGFAHMNPNVAMSLQRNMANPYSNGGGPIQQQDIIPPASMRLLKARHEEELGELEEVIEEQRYSLDESRIQICVLERANKELRLQLSKASTQGQAVQTAIEKIQAQVKGIKSRHRAEQDAMQTSEYNHLQGQKVMSEEITALKHENERFREVTRTFYAEKEKAREDRETMETEIDRLKDANVLEKSTTRKREKAFRSQVLSRLSQLGNNFIAASDVLSILDTCLSAPRKAPRKLYQ